MKKGMYMFFAILLVAVFIMGCTRGGLYGNNTTTTGGGYGNTTGGGGITTNTTNGTTGYGTGGTTGGGITGSGNATNETSGGTIGGGTSGTGNQGAGGNVSNVATGMNNYGPYENTLVRFLSFPLNVNQSNISTITVSWTVGNDSYFTSGANVGTTGTTGTNETNGTTSTTDNTSNTTDNTTNTGTTSYSGLQGTVYDSSGNIVSTGDNSGNAGTSTDNTTIQSNDSIASANNTTGNANSNIGNQNAGTTGVTTVTYINDTSSFDRSIYNADINANYTTHTSVHYDVVSHPGRFGLNVTPTDAGYQWDIPDYANGVFGIPRDFTATISLPLNTTANTDRLYMRAHAVINGHNYWTPEYIIDLNSPLNTTYYYAGVNESSYWDFISSWGNVTWVGSYGNLTTTNMTGNLTGNVSGNFTGNETNETGEQVEPPAGNI